MKSVLLLVTVLLSATFSLAATKGPRASHPFGAVLTGHGHPAPSTLGLEAGLHPNDFVRLSAGVGGHNNTMANVPRHAYNYLIRPIPFAILQAIKPVVFGLAWAMDGFSQFIGSGKVRTHIRYREFWKGANWEELETPLLERRTILSYGAGGQIFVPNWGLSPTLGIHWAQFDTTGSPMGLPAKQGHLYYSAGLDWVSEGGLNIGAGFNYCPKLPKAACGVSVQFGTFY